MKLFKLIEIDLEKERARINTPRRFNARQRRALLKLCDLFEAGKWKECLKHVTSKKAFPYNSKQEYEETEHIGMEIGDVLQSLRHYNFYTQDQLLAQAREKIAREARTDTTRRPPAAPSRASSRGASRLGKGRAYG